MIANRRKSASVQRLENPYYRRRIIQQFVRRPYRPRDQFAPAVGALAFQHLIRTRRAKSAFKRADARRSRFRRQVPITVFTAGSQFEHRVHPCIEVILRQSRALAAKTRLTACSSTAWAKYLVQHTPQYTGATFSPARLASCTMMNSGSSTPQCRLMLQQLSRLLPYRISTYAPAGHSDRCYRRLR